MLGARSTSSVNPFYIKANKILNDQLSASILYVQQQVTKLKEQVASVEHTLETDSTLASGSLNKSSVGLGLVDNVADINKPISNSTQAALNLKQDASSNSTRMVYLDVNSSLTTLLGQKQATITDQSLSQSKIINLEITLQGKQPTILDNSLPQTKVIGLESALQGKQATILDNTLSQAKVIGLESTLQGKHPTILDNTLSQAKIIGLESALQGKQGTILDNTLAQSKIIGLVTALEGKQPLLTNATNVANVDITSSLNTLLAAKASQTGVTTSLALKQNTLSSTSRVNPLFVATSAVGTDNPNTLVDDLAGKQTLLNSTTNLLPQNCVTGLTVINTFVQPPFTAILVNSLNVLYITQAHLNTIRCYYSTGTYSVVLQLPDPSTYADNTFVHIISMFHTAPVTLNIRTFDNLPQRVIVGSSAAVSPSVTVNRSEGVRFGIQTVGTTKKWIAYN